MMIREFRVLFHILTRDSDRSFLTILRLNFSQRAINKYIFFDLQHEYGLVTYVVTLKDTF